MKLFAKQIRKSGFKNIETDLDRITKYDFDLTEELVQDIERIGDFLWKVTEVIDIEKVNSQLAVRSGVCYILESHNTSTTFTIISEEEDAVEGLIAMFLDIYYPATVKTLNRFLWNNRKTQASSAVVLVKTEDFIIREITQPVLLGEIRAPEYYIRRATLPVDIKTPVKVKELEVVFGGELLGLTLATDESKDLYDVELLRKLFKLIDSLFDKGYKVQ